METRGGGGGGGGVEEEELKRRRILPATRKLGRNGPAQLDQAQRVDTAGWAATVLEGLAPVEMGKASFLSACDLDRVRP